MCVFWEEFEEKKRNKKVFKTLLEVNKLNSQTSSYNIYIYTKSICIITPIKLNHSEDFFLESSLNKYILPQKARFNPYNTIEVTRATSPTSE